MPLALSFAASYTILAVTSPYLPILIRNLGYGPEIIGLFLGVFEVAGIVGPFLTGALADRFGRFRPALAISYGLVLATLLPLIYLRNPAIVLASLIVLAIGVRSIIPLTDTAVTIELGLSGNYGRVRSFGSLSFVVSALFLQYQPWLPLTKTTHIAFWAAAATAFAYCFLPLLPDRNPRDRKTAAPSAGRDNAAPRNFVDGPFIVGLLIIALSRLAMTPINSFFSLFIADELKWNTVSLMWALSAAAEIPFIYFSSRLIAKFGAPRLLAVSSAAVFIRLWVYALFPTPGGVVFGQLLHSFCYGLFHPAAVNFITTRVPPNRRATGMAMYLSLGSGLPNFLGSAIGGLVIAAFGYRALFASYGVFAVAGVVLYFSSRKALEAPTRAW
jgi:PPP family 3-phenylpropionic acid transporter